MYPCKQELEITPYNISHHDPFLQLPQLESPKMPQVSNMQNCSSMQHYGATSNLPSSMLTQDHIIHSQQLDSFYGNTGCGSDQIDMDQVTDWRVLDKFVASQLSNDQQHGHLDAPNKESNYNNSSIFHVSEDMNMVVSPNSDNQHLGVPSGSDQYASTSNSSCQIDMWK
ncbi:NAC domain-containing protein 7 [Bienertia sinuspersici]